ncbi:hypothetical protein P8605_09225 [Streptomyces sp. T-3]|nr:hypothetical protein [Streptomyces sp. T-3]
MPAEAIASVIAVLGTLLGVGVTHAFQRRALARSEAFARDERLRQERMDAYSSYAGTLINYRRSLIERRMLQDGHDFEEDATAMRARSYDLRTQAYEALFRVQMVTDKPGLATQAQDALDVVALIHKADDDDEFVARRDTAKRQIYAFVAAAKVHVS